MDKVRITVTAVLISIFAFIVPAYAETITAGKALKKAEEKSSSLSLSIARKEKDRVIVDVSVNPNGQAINAVGSVIFFPAGKLAVEKIDKANSFCFFFVEEKIDNKNGKINISCGRPTPGISKEANVARIIFKKKAGGWAKISLGNGSQVLANDGFGTDVLKSLKNQEVFIEK